MPVTVPPVVDFYDRHPISEAQILRALDRQGKDLARLRPEDLWPLDQDHYGGLPAVEALARRAAIDARSRVLDVCAGLGGPARYLAWRFGARVAGLELNAGRAAGGRRLTRLVGLERRVCMVRGDAERPPFRPATFTAVVSQEGLLHVPDKAAALAGCARVLRPGGRLAFTDWIATARLGELERRQLEQWMAAVRVETLEGYRTRLAKAGFVGIEAEDLSAEWILILRERRRMFSQMREDTVARLGEQRYEEYNQLYAFFVGLVEAGKLGGARFSATAGRAGA